MSGKSVIQTITCTYPEQHQNAINLYNNNVVVVKPFLEQFCREHGIDTQSLERLKPITEYKYLENLQIGTGSTRGTASVINNDYGKKSTDSVSVYNIHFIDVAFVIEKENNQPKKAFTVYKENKKPLPLDVAIAIHNLYNAQELLNLTDNAMRSIEVNNHAISRVRAEIWGQPTK